MLTSYSIILLGIFTGVILAFFLEETKQKVIITFTAGSLIAFICFEMLPVSFDMWGIYFSIIAIFIGVLFATTIEKILANKYKSHNKSFRLSILIALSMILHNIPEGLALGSILNFDYDQGLRLAILIAIHCIPEVCSVFILSKQNGGNIYSFIIYGFFISIPILIGICVGNYITVFSHYFIAGCLSFAGGVMLYTACGEALFESKETNKNIKNSIFACLGFIFGIIIIYNF